MKRKPTLTQSSLNTIVLTCCSTLALAQTPADSARTKLPVEKQPSIKGGVKVFYVKDDKPLEYPKAYPFNKVNMEDLNAVEQDKIKKAQNKSSEPK